MRPGSSFFFPEPHLLFHPPSRPCAPPHGVQLGRGEEGGVSALARFFSAVPRSRYSPVPQEPQVRRLLSPLPRSSKLRSGPGFFASFGGCFVRPAAHLMRHLHHSGNVTASRCRPLALVRCRPLGFPPYATSKFSRCLCASNCSFAVG